VTFKVLDFEVLIGEVAVGVGVGAVPVRVFILVHPSLQSPPYDGIPSQVGLRAPLALQLSMITSVEIPIYWHVTVQYLLLSDLLNIV
jgi:hypothetical protein